MRKYLQLTLLGLLCTVAYAQDQQLAYNDASQGSFSEALVSSNEKKKINPAHNVIEPSKKEIRHQVKVYVGENGKVYFQKNQDVYLWVSSSGDQSSQKYLLTTDNGAADHFRLDTEGKNTIRSPWAVDLETGEYKSPREDVVFDVFADGMPPATVPQFTGAPRHFKKGTMYYGKGLQIKLNSKEQVAGVDNIYVSVDGQDYKPYENTLDIVKEDQRSISYYAVDNVGNVETPNTKKFIVDITPPSTQHRLTGITDGNVISASAKVVLESQDNLSGVKSIKYKIGKDGTYKTYSEPISMSGERDGNVSIYYYAEDQVKNTEVEKSTNDNNVAIHNLYVDRVAPEVKINLNGDQFKGKYDYISNRTKISLIAEDNKSGVAKITYGINTSSRSQEYVEEFSPLEKNGLQYINCSAVDQVRNIAKAKSRLVYLDKTIPKTNIKFSGKQFINMDTLYITKDTKIHLSSHETESGLKKINYSIDERNPMEYSEVLTVEQEGFHTIQYFAQDNVNNTETAKSHNFVVDNTPPKLNHTFSIQPLGIKTIRGQEYHVLPKNAKIYLAASDKTTGVDQIWYSLNNSPTQQKTVIQYFKPGTFLAKVHTRDVLGNESSEVIRFIIE